ncbi:hypothetical protein FQR65_LT20645 [Abscondita terminalis]|nr:hypothetical protein FQR65_LT20645 [Abscondita terminalis]
MNTPARLEILRVKDGPPGCFRRDGYASPPDERNCGGQRRQVKNGSQSDSWASLITRVLMPSINSGKTTKFGEAQAMPVKQEMTETAVIGHVPSRKRVFGHTLVREPDTPARSWPAARAGSRAYTEIVSGCLLLYDEYGSLPFDCGKLRIHLYTATRCSCRWGLNTAVFDTLKLFWACGIDHFTIGGG